MALRSRRSVVDDISVDGGSVIVNVVVFCEKMSSGLSRRDAVHAFECFRSSAERNAPAGFHML